MSDNIQEAPIVLITGGTKGIGLAIAKRFAATGYHCIITYFWGSVKEADIIAEFTAKQLPPPWMIQANVADPEDTQQLLQQISKKYSRIDVFISNVAFCSLVNNMDGYSEKSLLKSIEYSTWPLIEYPRQIKEILGHFPRYIIGFSSDGIDKGFVRYDFVAASKTIMEVLVRYLNYHFFNKDIIFNIVRTRPIITESSLAILGNEFISFIKENDISGTSVDLDEFAKTVLMLCSGLMDGIRGQTLTVDNGFSFADSLISLYSQRENYI